MHYLLLSQPPCAVAEVGKTCRILVHRLSTLAIIDPRIQQLNFPSPTIDLEPALNPPLLSFLSLVSHTATRRPAAAALPGMLKSCTTLVTVHPAGAAPWLVKTPHRRKYPGASAPTRASSHANQLCDAEVSWWKTVPTGRTQTSRSVSLSLHSRYLPLSPSFWLSIFPQQQARDTSHTRPGPGWCTERGRGGGGCTVHGKRNTYRL